MPTDPFGLRRERKINASGVREVFTPHTPVNSIELFRGRQRQVQQLIEQMNTPGQHALLFGERGVGKTSLANIVAEVLSAMMDYKLYIKRCDSSETFESILAGPLRDAGVAIDVIDRTERSMKERSGGIKPHGIGIDYSDHSETVDKIDMTVRLQPSVVAENLKDHQGLLLIDEADAIRDRDDRRKLAELIKLLSDSNSDLKVLVVGIAETGGHLMGEHPSVQRCLKETQLSGMTEAELRAIITLGADELGLDFEDEITDRIVQVSGGYPHFTHLLALKAAEEAIASDRTLVTQEDLEAAVKTAVEDAEGTLTRRYNEAIRSYETDMFRIVLVAAASIERTEFSAADLRRAIHEVRGEPIKQNSLNNYLNRLVSDGRDTVLRRIRKGIYRFNDPRMPAFVKIANELV